MTVDTAPSVRPALDWHFPLVAASDLANGLRLLVLDCPGQFVVSANLVFDVPLDAEPRSQEGVSALVARCLTRGAGTLTADEFSDSLAACGAELDAHAAPDAFTVQLSVPVTHLRRGIELMALAVREPTFAIHEVDQERRLRLQEIEHAKAYPGPVTVDRLNAALFGEARAARPTGGTTESVAGLTRDDVVAFAGEHLHPRLATLVLAGDVRQHEVRDIVDEAFGDWTAVGTEVGELAAPQVSDTPRLIVVDWPDATQATLRIAGRGITRGDDQWPALFVANYVVGGSFGSRLNTLLRERKGLTYGVSSSLDSSRRTGLFGIGASVRVDAVGEAVDDTLGVLRAAGGDLSDDEVRTAVGAVTDSAPLGFERAASVAARVEMLLAHRLPLSHVDTNLARMRAVIAADANAAFADLLRPDELTVVIAAPAATTVESLAATGYAPVEVVPRPA